MCLFSEAIEKALRSCIACLRNGRDLVEVDKVDCFVKIKEKEKSKRGGRINTHSLPMDGDITLNPMLSRLVN